MNEQVLEEARNIIASFLKNRRLELKMSQQDVADATGLARKTINAMEAGKFWLGMKQYLLICHALHLFPVIAEMESDTPIAEQLRKNWVAHDSIAPLDEILKKKNSRYGRNDQDN